MWADLFSQQNVMLKVMREAAQDGLDVTRDDSSTAARLHEMQDFYAYMERALPPLIDGWREQYRH